MDTQFLAARGRSVVFVLAIGVWGVVSSSAAAFDDPASKSESKKLTADQRAQAKAHFLTGSEHFADQNYELAIQYFRQAFDLTQSPEIIYNIGRCHEELGQLDAAIENYNTYLHTYPDADDADEVKHRITMLSAIVEEQQKENSLNGDESLEDEPITEPEEETDPPEWLSGLRLGAHAGGAATLTGVTDSIVATVGLQGHYEILDWLALSIAGTGGYYFNDYLMTDPRFYVAAFGGGRGAWRVFGPVMLTASAGLRYTWIEIRRGSLHWLAAAASGGAIYPLTDWLWLTGEATAAFGYIFGEKKHPEEEFADPDLQTEVGGRLAVEFVF